MLVSALADTRCRVRRGAITPRKEQGCTFHSEEALTDKLVDLIFRHHRVVAEVRHHLCPAAGAEADRRRAVGAGHGAEGHAGGGSAEREKGVRCSWSVRKLLLLSNSHVLRHCKEEHSGLP